MSSLEKNLKIEGTKIEKIKEITRKGLEKHEIIRIDHGTIIRTGLTCKKISSYMHDSAYRWLIVENFKIFRSYVKHF